MSPLDLITYVIPIARTDTGAPDVGLTCYLHHLAQHCSVVVVDGSPPEVFAADRGAWSGAIRHTAPDPALACTNGKVQGVLTGLDLVDTPLMVIADDDVRYTIDELERCVQLLGTHDLVRPQNVFDPLPWHARWDTARSVLNRAVGVDFPGTLAVRTDSLRRTGGYDGNVMFENLELIRTIEAAGGTTVSPLGLYVTRRPPTTQHFLGQRVRQAYDEFARPVRLAAFALAPVVLIMTARRWGAAPIGLSSIAVVIAAAEVGRRRAGGARHFPATTSLLAPLWVVERMICSWLALWCRARGGVPYRGRRVHRAANSSRTLRARHSRRRDA